MSIDSRLKMLERVLAPPPPPVPLPMEGSVEIHCVGGSRHVRGKRCKEHKACVFQATPVMGRVRRQILMRWEPGMTEIMEIG